MQPRDRKRIYGREGPGSDVASPYEVLGVSPDDDLDTVKTAYRARVKDAHPDQGGSARAFRRVTAAYRAITSDDWSPRTDDPSPDDVSEPGVAHVEYLDYEILKARDWSIDDDRLFERAADADLDPARHGSFEVDRDRALLEAAEGCGLRWPFACRGGACANCAVAVHDGDLSNPGDNILPSDLLDRGIRLSCIGEPVTDELAVVVGLQAHPDLEDLRLPPDRFERARSSD